MKKAIATTIRAIFLRFVPNLLQFDCIIGIIKIRKEQKTRIAMQFINSY